MNIGTSAAVQSATTAAQGADADAVHIAVLKKALDAQKSGAMALIQSIPPAPSLATSGAVGTRINTYA